MDGILNINKPSGITSHDLVYQLRKITGEKKIGHTGTLDPAASGVMILCLGKATRIVEYLSKLQKSYEAVIRFGIETDSEDASGEVINRSDCDFLTDRQIRSVLPSFIGSIMQIPPMVSAIHHNGKRLYQLAREGVIVERTPRPVTIFDLEMDEFLPGKDANARLMIKCSTGTYIRTLCADIGKALGCGAHMESLVRTSVNNFTLETAFTPSQINELIVSDKINDILIGMNDALSFLPFLNLSGNTIDRIINGIKLDIVEYNIKQSLELESPVRICNDDGKLIAIGRFSFEPAIEKVVLRPDKVFCDSDKG